ncbi:ABC transporter ATP-binding protein [Microbacterium sp. AG1240]|uniref:ATP-binding cassette domain-containing protein n=1 Tax=Microbacterium sp. AG1240 TaxID=2183992 RepID=UPI000EB23837
MAPLLTVEDVHVVFGSGRKAFTALNGVSLDIRPGETMGLVGESGSGKTTIGRAILGLVAPTQGTITFDGRDITRLRAAERRSLARDVQVIFQDPYSSLNPSMTVADILAEPLLIQGWTRRDAYARIRELLDRVGLPGDADRRLPREFSGGQRQRIAIARSIALGPKLIICDEPVSALDLTTQARVLDLLVEIQEATGVAYLFVSHDLGVVRHISHRVMVLYRGDVVEEGEVDQVTARPAHPYTQRLFMSAPVADVALQRARREERRLLVAKKEDRT